MTIIRLHLGVFMTQLSEWTVMCVRCNIFMDLYNLNMTRERSGLNGLAGVCRMGGVKGVRGSGGWNGWRGSGPRGWE